MLKLMVPGEEFWDEKVELFINKNDQELQLEHSLVSLSKWESIKGKPFFTKDNKTFDETILYIKCMTITQNVDNSVYDRLTDDDIQQINKYIEAPMTATTFFNEKSGKRGSETVTAELIYYWMIALNIPFECQKWHLNRLLTLIKVCNIKNQPPKKQSKSEILKRNAAINAARRQQFNKG